MNMVNHEIVMILLTISTGRGWGGGVVIHYTDVSLPLMIGLPCEVWEVEIFPSIPEAFILFCEGEGFVENIPATEPPPPCITPRT